MHDLGIDSEEGKDRELILLVIQLKKRLKHDDATYLVMIREVQAKTLDIISKVLVYVLLDFIEMIPIELLDGCHQDVKWTTYAIKLVPSAKPLGMTSYQMTTTDIKNCNNS